MVKRFTGGLLSPRTPSVSSSSATGFWSFVDAAQNRSNVSWPNGYLEYLPINIFMVAGGGAGGPFVGAGGGAGGVLVGSLINYPERGTYTIYIGAGAASGAEGTNGSNTAIAFGGANLYTAFGGGGARSMTGDGTGVIIGNDGGSGGGGAGNRGGVTPGGNATQTTQLTLTGYGYPGGTGTASGDPVQPGGGGGATQTGGNGIPNPASGGTYAGYGGDGIYNNYRTGTNIGYAGGGAGTSYSFYDAVVIPTNKRHLYGGGHTGTSANLDAVVNTGGGGGGGGFPPFYTAAQGIGAGGSGIVIIRYPTNFITATGGNVTNYTSNGVSLTAHTFTESNTFTITGVSWRTFPTPTSVEYLVVAGGGGGGNGGGSAYETGGGGAGGLIYHPSFSVTSGLYTITVGGGGAYNTNGANSTVSYNSSNVLTAIGGGYSTNNSGPGQIGGSGGGGTHNGTAGGAGVQTTNQSITADSRTYGFGNAGGNGATSAGGGGGGAGAAGTNAPGSANAGAGGIGKQYNISGTSTYYAGGGGGGVTSAAGGLGGGGAGTAGSPGNPGTPNTGGGGGGVAGSAGSTGGAGGSGVVILRYPDSFAAAITTGSPNVTISGGYISYRFWQSGTIVF